jgi:hypothetical protein
MWKRRSLALRLEPFRAGEPHRIGVRARKYDPEKTGYGDDNYGNKTQDKSSFPAAGQNDCRRGGQFGRARRFGEGGDVAGRDGGR